MDDKETIKWNHEGKYIMSDEDRNMANAALLLDETIGNRIAAGVADSLRNTIIFGALLENSAFQQAIRNMIETEVAKQRRMEEANKKSMAQTSSQYTHKTYYTKGTK